MHTCTQQACESCFSPGCEVRQESCTSSGPCTLWGRRTASQATRAWRRAPGTVGGALCVEEVPDAAVEARDGLLVESPGPRYQGVPHRCCPQQRVRADLRGLGSRGSNAASHTVYNHCAKVTATCVQRFCFCKFPSRCCRQRCMRCGHTGLTSTAEFRCYPCEQYTYGCVFRSCPI